MILLIVACCRVENSVGMSADPVRESACATLFALPCFLLAAILSGALIRWRLFGAICVGRIGVIYQDNTNEEVRRTAYAAVFWRRVIGAPRQLGLRRNGPRFHPGHGHGIHLGEIASTPPNIAKSAEAKDKSHSKRNG